MNTAVTTLGPHHTRTPQCYVVRNFVTSLDSHYTAIESCPHLRADLHGDTYVVVNILRQLILMTQRSSASYALVYRWRDCLPESRHARASSTLYIATKSSQVECQTISLTRTKQRWTQSQIEPVTFLKRLPFIARMAVFPFQVFSAIPSTKSQLSRIVFTLRAVQHPASIPLSVASLTPITQTTQFFTLTLFSFFDGTT